MVQKSNYICKIQYFYKQQSYSIKSCILEHERFLINKKLLFENRLTETLRAFEKCISIEVSCRRDSVMKLLQCLTKCACLKHF